MFTNIKNKFISVIAPDIPPLPSLTDHQIHRLSGSQSAFNYRMAQHHMQDKITYARPTFLQLLTPDELKASADHNVRPIIVPRDISLLPWGTGYAECVNSGKSEWNEDQAAFSRYILSDPSNKHSHLPYTYFGIFDGHAGYGAALAASHQFHHILHEKLVDCIELLLPRDEEPPVTQATNGFPHPSHFHRRVSKDELIVGALESAFFHMDSLIAQDRDRYRDAGGCTACVSLFIDGKMYVANAGDSRAVLCQRKLPAGDMSESDTLGSYPVPFSFDHTPETERQRLLGVAVLNPHLISKQYVATEYAKRPHAKDLGQRILCRQGSAKGWTYKTLTPEDLRMPVVIGEGKRSRLLGTLGVTRGFGDHDLVAINTGTLIKPFLTPLPDVSSRDLLKIVSIPDENNRDGDYGILIMATDGLWDVSENETVARTVFQTLNKFPTEKHRYTMVAQELVARARGKINDFGHWRLADSKAAATVDDISVIVIPVYQYFLEHLKWVNSLQSPQEGSSVQRKETIQAIEAKESDMKILNSLTTGQIEISADMDEDEDEEEIVVEVNRQQVQATIEMEDDNKTNANQQSTNSLNVADKKNENDSMDTFLDFREASSLTTNISATNNKESRESSPQKTSNSKQQRNRNRKEKR